MKKFIAKAAAGAAVIAAALLVAPVAAQAVAPVGYPDNNQITISNTTGIAPGAPVSIIFSDGSFAPGAPVTFYLTGENAVGGGIAMIHMASNTLTQTLNANGQGGLTATVTLPSDAQCDYSVTAKSGSWTSPSWKISASTCGAANSNGLALTGANAPFLWTWVGAGAAALIGGGVLVAVSVRRQRKLAE